MLVILFFLAFIGFSFSFSNNEALFNITSQVDGRIQLQQLATSFHSEIRVNLFEENSDNWISSVPLDRDEMLLTAAPPGTEELEAHGMSAIGMFGSPVYVAANVPGISSIILDVECVALMFNGDITNWNDSRIQALNPGATLPGQVVLPVLLTDSFAYDFFESTLANEIGKTEITLPPSTIRIPSVNVSDVAFRVSGAIVLVPGGVYYGSMTFVIVKNQGGHYVTISHDSITANFLENIDKIKNPLLISTSKNEGSYPFTMIIYAVMPEEYYSDDERDCSAISFMMDFLIAILNDHNEANMLQVSDSAAMSHNSINKLTAQIKSTFTCDDESLELAVDERHLLSCLGVGMHSLLEVAINSIYRRVMGEYVSLSVSEFDTTTDIAEAISKFEEGEVAALTITNDGELDISIDTIAIPIGQYALQLLINIPTLSLDDEFVMSVDTLELFMDGCYSHWDDPDIIADNPTLDLPHTAVTMYDLVNLNLDAVFTPTGKKCENGEIKSQISPATRLITPEFLCMVPGGSFPSIILQDGSSPEGYSNYPCVSSTSTIIGVNMLTDDGRTLKPNAEVLSSYGSTSIVEAYERESWPLCGYVALYFPKHIVAKTNIKSKTDYGRIFDDGCDVSLHVQTTLRELLLNHNMANNFNSLALFPVWHPREIVAAEDILSMTCNGELLFGSDNDDLEVVLYWTLGISGTFGIATLTVIMILYIKNAKSDKSRKFLVKRVEIEHNRVTESSRMMAWINHEIRNLLNGVLGLSLFARETLQEAEEETSLRRAQELIQSAAKDINTVVQSSQLMSVMVNDVMKLSQLEEGKLNSVKTNTNLCKLINTVLKVFRPKFSEKPNVSIKVSTFAECAERNFQLDAVHTMQILANFVGNAIKFTDEGTIRIILTKPAGQRIIRFEVQDTGCGIPKELKPSIFNGKWVQADTKERTNGSGFGLFLCHGLVTRVLKGKIGFTSVVSIGSSFFFEVPYEEVPEIGINDFSSSSCHSDNSLREVPSSDDIKHLFSARTQTNDSLGALKEAQYSSGNSGSIIEERVPSIPSIKSAEKYGLKKNSKKMVIERIGRSESSSEGFTSRRERTNTQHTLASAISKGTDYTVYDDNFEGPSHHRITTPPPPTIRRSRQGEMFDDCLKSPQKTRRSQVTSIGSSRRSFPIVGFGEPNGNESLNTSKSHVFRMPSLSLKSTSDDFEEKYLKKTSENIFSEKEDIENSNYSRMYDERPSTAYVPKSRQNLSPNETDLRLISMESLALAPSNNNSARKSFTSNSLANSSPLLPTSANRFLSDPSDSTNSDLDYSRGPEAPILLKRSSRTNRLGLRSNTMKGVSNISIIDDNNSCHHSIHSQKKNQQYKQQQQQQNIGRPPKYALQQGSGKLKKRQKNNNKQPLIGAKILVTDDSPVNRLILRRCLTKAGAEVIEACDGQAAVEAWQEIQSDPSQPNIDLIWMDVVMPRMLGTEASKKLRELGCKCAIIACTGNVQANDKRECLESGMTRLEPKPLNISRTVDLSQYYFRLGKRE
eukprot:TRINITY_DN2607_c0_g7_i1.p1 TRINITY_DN2607_c0_g7~~TRINITY_DN2607_c0_g7_i1.p1  ORF type:complete len:1518 (+),score=349.28 TRINITY_DN2607_c0_g7_i1:68-4621(+)